MTWSAKDIIEATGGRLQHAGRKQGFGEIVTNSTEVKKGSVFVALKGDRLDGHRFVGDAVARGAGCLVVHRPLRGSALRKTAVIKVPDTLRALGDLAHFRRRQYAPRVMAVTGSNGKTTTKEMLAAILERASVDGQPLKGKVLKTEGNFNNLVGLPLTLLRLRRRDRVAVVEMGTNRPGEIQRLAEIAAPDMAIITSVAAAHLQGLRNLAGVGKEKGALFDAVRRGGTIAVNLDDPWVSRLAKKHSGKKITYGKHGRIRAEYGASLNSDGMRFILRVGQRRQPVRLRFVGRHNIANALGAAAMAHAFGVTLPVICDGLERVKPLPMRMRVENWRGVGIINDAYNANPASMQAAIRALAEIPCRGQKIAVLGDMFELGKRARQQHAELGNQVARARIDRLYVLGAHATQVRNGALRGGLRPDRVLIGKDYKDLATRLRSQIGKGDWLLLKGSRAMAMEKILQELKG
jgi:UDP-N-acetylmuramoyl-tripeptide--D-alanyl-D-alanine ligase